MAQSNIYFHYECMGKAIVEAKDMRRISFKSLKFILSFLFDTRLICMYVIPPDLLKTDNGRILVLYTLSNNLWNLLTELYLSIRVKISIRNVL